MKKSLVLLVILFGFVNSNAQDYANPENLEFDYAAAKKRQWTFRFYFGFSRTEYLPVDVHLRSDRINVLLKDFELDERTSANFYNPRNWQSVTDAFRWIDEPTNSFMLSAERNKHIFYLNVFHPKFLKERDQTKHVIGTIDGVSVNDEIPINQIFDGYNNQLGEMNLVRFQNTHRQLDIQIGYGKKFIILSTRRFGEVSYTPQIYVGLSMGEHVTVYRKFNEYWDFDNFKDETRIQGANYSAAHMLKYDYKRFGVWFAQKITLAQLSHGFMDQGGRADYDLVYVNFASFGVSFKLWSTKPTKRLPGYPEPFKFEYGQ